MQQFSQRSATGKNRVYTNFSLWLTAEGAPIHEQNQARSAGKRDSAILRMARLNVRRSASACTKSGAKRRKARQRDFANGASERQKKRQCMYKIRREAPESASARFCEWRV